MKFTKNFSELSKNSVDIAGGKGASLGEMTQAGIPVPPGYVVLSDAFERFIEETDINVEIDAVLDRVDSKQVHTVEEASEKIQALIKNAKMPIDIKNEAEKEFKKLGAKYVAVRSSATSEDSADAAWAGQLDSFLNTDKDYLMQNIQNCWASLFTPRAIAYRFEKKLHKTKISVAVVVQKMVQSEESGVAFSVHPITQDYNQIIIEASYGLGEAIVSGQVTPDSYVIDKQDWKILDKNVYTQTRGIFRKGAGNEWKNIPEPKAKHQVLSDEEIVELAKIIKQIELHYGFPCDIEFAKEKRKFYIVQSRPITTLLGKESTLPKPVLKEKKLSDFEKLKNILKQPLDAKEARFAIPVSQIMFTAFTNPNVLGDDYGVVFVPYSGEKGKQIIPEKEYNMLERNTWTKAIKNKKKFEKLLKNATKIQKEIDSSSLSPKKLSLLKNKSLLNYYKKIVKKSIKWWAFGSIGEDKGLVVEEKLVPLITQNHSVSEEYAREYVSDMTMPDEISIFSKERIAFLELCILTKSNPSLLKSKTNKKFEKKLGYYSKKYFYARTSFYEPVSLEKQDLVNLIEETCKNNKLSILKEEYKKLLQSEKTIKQNKKKHKMKFVPTKDESDYLWYFKLMHIWMDERKASMMKHVYYLLCVLKEVSERTNIDYDFITSMTHEEIESVIVGKKINLKKIVERKKNCFFVYRKNKIDVFVGKKAKELFDSIPSQSPSENLIKGSVASKGKKLTVKGKVRIVHNPMKDEFNAGEILVTTMTRPEFVPIMKKAKAIITDEGGLTSHAAIVSRELGVPCIIGTKYASTMVENGQEVEMNLENGSVKLISLLADLKKEDWFFWGRWKDSLLPQIPFVEYVCSKNFKKFGVDFSGDALVVDGYFYTNKNDFLKMQKKVIRYWEDKKLFDKFFKQAENIIADSNPTNSLSQNFKKIDELVWVVFTTHYFDRAAEDYIKNKISEDNLRSEDVFSEIIPYKKSLYSKYEEMLQKTPEKNLQDVVDKFPWAGMRMYLGEPLTIEQAKKDKQSLKHKNKVKSKKFPKEIQDIIEIGSKLSYLRAIGDDLMNCIAFSIRKDLKKLSEKENIPYVKIVNATRSEILNGFDRRDILKRSDKDALVFINKELCIIEYEKAKFILDLFSEKNDYSVSVKGQIANKGVVIGRTKLVESVQDLKKVSHGDIIVAPETTPDYIMAMRVASAFVTNQGGITSHAAIVSREMDKPCIIGTGNATQVLKDGDLVEVDANKGIVKILSKEKILKKNDSANNLKHIEKVIGRDLPLANIFAWHKGYTIGMKNTLGWGYSDSVFFVKGEVSDILRSPDEYKKAFKNFVLQKVKNDEKWLEKLSLNFKKLTKEMYSFFEKNNPKINKFNNKKVCEIYEKYIDYVSKVIGPFIVFYWVPNWLEDKQKEKLNSKYFKISMGNRKLSENIFPKGDILVNNILDKVSKETKIQKSLLYFISKEELIKYLNSGKKPNIAILKKRQKGFIYSNKGITLVNSSIKSAFSSIGYDYDDSPLESKNEIKGQSACEGKAKGKVKIILKKNQIKSIKKGEILVTSMTTPEFVTAMKIADAIITDEGGLTCHAAIVARELKKPCIIGTKNSTKILKDGDLVEVDADEGIVKLISLPVVDEKNLFDEFIKDLKKPYFDFSGSWSPLLCLCSLNYKPFYDLYKSSNSPILLVVKGRDSHFLFSDTLYNNYSLEMFSQFIKKKRSLFDLKNTFLNLSKQIDTLYKTKITDPKKTIENMYWLISELIAKTIYVETFDKQKVEFVLKKNINEKEWDSVISFDFLHFDTRWNIAVQKAKSIEEIEYVFTDYYFPKPTKEIEKEVKKINSLKLEKPPKSTIKNFDTNNSDWKDFCRFVIILRDYRKDPIAKAQATIARCAKMIFPKLTASDLANIYPLELVNDSLPSVKEIKNRRDGAVMYLDTNNNFSYSVKQYSKVLNEISNKEDVEEISGNSAFKGTTQGIVRVVLNPNQKNLNFKKGDILVTSMTRPEFVPLMKLAGAIVTNEGGITCHASIVSRELKIPCIVGTKIATQVLKDGDLVEVDANKGIVKLVEKKK